MKRAQSLLSQGRNTEAEEMALRAALEAAKAGELLLLAEALTTHGIALARLGEHEGARLSLERAVETAEQAGDEERAGLAALTMLEELRGQLTEDEMRGVYQRADELLAGSNDLTILQRARDCARYIFEMQLKRDSTAAETRFIYAAEETGALLRRALRVAITDSTVLITGETGTGKEVLARLIHEWSGRAGSFVAINCRTLTDLLSESQLFGHAKGSYQDALQDQRGAVREAAGGTLFLDEVTELSRTNQGKLLRLIERGEIHTIGASMPERINVRVIASTSRKLKDEADAGRFRDDLFYRLQTFQLDIPPLRERVDDIAAIAGHFIEEGSLRYRKRVRFSPDGLVAMGQLPLSGNARELRSLIERIMVASADGATVSADEVQRVALEMAQQPEAAREWEGCSLDEEVLSYEKSLIRLALNASEGKVTQAAQRLGITHQLLSFILNTRHKDLLEARKPVRARRRSSMRPRSDKQLK